MKCKKCGAEEKELLTSTYCDCENNKKKPNFKDYATKLNLGDYAVGVDLAEEITQKIDLKRINFVAQLRQTNNTWALQEAITEICGADCERTLDIEHYRDCRKNGDITLGSCFRFDDYPKVSAADIEALWLSFATRYKEEIVAALHFRKEIKLNDIVRMPGSSGTIDPLILYGAYTITATIKK